MLNLADKSILSTVRQTDYFNSQKSPRAPCPGDNSTGITAPEITAPGEIAVGVTALGVMALWVTADGHLPATVNNWVNGTKPNPLPGHSVKDQPAAQ